MMYCIIVIITIFYVNKIKIILLSQYLNIYTEQIYLSLDIKSIRNNSSHGSSACLNFVLKASAQCPVREQFSFKLQYFKLMYMTNSDWFSQNNSG